MYDENQNGRDEKSQINNHFISIEGGYHVLSFIGLD
jgi:hypothetical protein